VEHIERIVNFKLSSDMSSNVGESHTIAPGITHGTAMERGLRGHLNMFRNPIFTFSTESLLKKLNSAVKGLLIESSGREKHVFTFDSAAGLW
jgi:hypothetical protein